MRERSVIPSPGRQLAIQAPWTVASMRALLCMLCMCLLATPAWAQKRMALVIGNGDYVHESRLNNPVTSGPGHESSFGPSRVTRRQNRRQIYRILQRMVLTLVG